VIAGTLDLITGPAQARRIADGTREADLVLIPDCGHLLAVEEPAAYKTAIMECVALHP
jgi:pimeloyl-ACP methyl ester carboxylesterase